jgi:hypothetical protein
MTDAAIKPLTIVGDPSMGVCEGDFCEIPDHHEASIINRRVDADEI